MQDTYFVPGMLLTTAQNRKSDTNFKETCNTFHTAIKYTNNDDMKGKGKYCQRGTEKALRSPLGPWVVNSRGRDPGVFSPALTSSLEKAQHEAFFTQMKGRQLTWEQGRATQGSLGAEALRPGSLTLTWTALSYRRRAKQL